MVLLRTLLGDALRHRRLGQGRTLREVSSRARVSLGYLSEVERGQKEASSELLGAICGALDVPMSRVLRDVSDQLAVAEGSRPSAAAGRTAAPVTSAATSPPTDAAVSARSEAPASDAASSPASDPVLDAAGGPSEGAAAQGEAPAVRACALQPGDASAAETPGLVGLAGLDEGRPSLSGLRGLGATGDGQPDDEGVAARPVLQVGAAA